MGTIVINEFTNGATGHVNITFLDDNGIPFRLPDGTDVNTYGLNIDGLATADQNSGVYNEQRKLLDGLQGGTVTRREITVDSALEQQVYNEVRQEAAQTAVGNGPTYFLKGKNCVDWVQSKLDELHAGTTVVSNLEPKATLVYGYAAYDGVIHNTPFQIASGVEGSLAAADGRLWDKLAQIILSNFLGNHPDAAPGPELYGPEIVVTYNPGPKTWSLDPVVPLTALPPGSIISPPQVPSGLVVELPNDFLFDKPGAGLLGHVEGNNFVPDVSLSGTLGDGSDTGAPALWDSYADAASGGSIGGGFDDGGGGGRGGSGSGGNWGRDDGGGLQANTVGQHMTSPFTVYYHGPGS